MDDLFLNQKTNNNIRITYSLKYKPSKKNKLFKRHTRPKILHLTSVTLSRSYVYYVTRVFIASTRAFNLANGAFSLLTREFELITCGFELVTPGLELVTRGFELVPRNS